MHNLIGPCREEYKQWYSCQRVTHNAFIIERIVSVFDLDIVVQKKKNKTTTKNKNDKKQKRQRKQNRK